MNTVTGAMGLMTIDQREEAILAPYATKSRESLGREFREKEHHYRGPFQRDRDRILHSAAYRRLSGKMQVFTGDQGDYHRTRLTHTQEVASIARTLGRALRLNEDLIEALALFHDIGHPPYGHAGEDALQECLKNHGGFSHNQFGLTLARELENPYPDFPGLNLTREVLAGQDHRAHKDSPIVPSLEVQLVDAADSMTYDAHDTDDAVKLAFVTLDDLSELSLTGRLLRDIQQKFTAADPRTLRRNLAHDLIELQVTNLLETTTARLEQTDFSSSAGVQEARFRLVISEQLRREKSELEEFLYDRVYRHEELIRVRSDAQHRLKMLFLHFCAQHRSLPERNEQRVQTIGRPRAVGEYLASMTDRYCDQRFDEVTAAGD
ncbi:MAG: dNTP triphosphohydrolase [Pirellulaceae bacterium]